MVTLVRMALGIFWGLWFGGIMAVFVFAITFFRELDRGTATIATGIMFPAFERYTLVVAALALAAAVSWRALDKSRAASLTFVLLAVATLLAIVSAVVVTPRILYLRSTGQTHTPEFAKTHGESGAIYVAEAIALLGAGVVFVAGGPAGTLRR